MIDTSGSSIFVKDTEESERVKKPIACWFYDKPYIADGKYYAKEKYIAEKICTRTHHNSSFFTNDAINDCIKEYEDNEHITLSDEQREGVILLLTNPFAVLTGGPGTGKTSVLKCILYCIEKLDPWTEEAKCPILCLSPTGKAARRMTEATNYPAQTILKSINYNPGRGSFSSLIKKYIFVDEASMIDIDTMYLLMKSVENNTNARIYLIGDMEQLPSVGAGAVLRDIINSQAVPVNSLVKTFRQKEGSTLLENIKILKKGCNYPLINGFDFEKHDSIEEFLPLYYKTIAEVGYKNVVVLTPNRKVGKYCSENLNKIIQKKLNNKSGYKATFERDGRTLHITFKYGDPVIQLVNREVANGDIGVVVFANDKRVVVQFENGQKLTYDSNTINQLDLAYAISIHKSQGSEYPIAFVLCDKSRLLDRNMIYTAVTRAKKKCFIFGNEDFISESCKKQSTWTRTNALFYLLEEEALKRKILTMLM